MRELAFGTEPETDVFLGVKCWQERHVQDNAHPDRFSGYRTLCIEGNQTKVNEKL